MSLDAPWVRELTYYLERGIFLATLWTLLAACLQIYRSKRRLRVDDVPLIAGLAFLIGVPYVLSRDGGRLERTVAGGRIMDAFLFTCACWIAWLYFGPGRRERS
jgi:hypothetical protein